MVKDEAVQSLNVHLFVADDVSSDKLTAVLVIESLHGNVVDAGELADYCFHLFQLDAEAANLHLSVTTSHKLNVAVGQITDDVTGAVAARILAVCSFEGVVDKYLRLLFRSVQIAARYLWATNPQFSGSAYRQTVSLWVNNIQSHIVERFTDRYLFQLLVHVIGGSENGTLCRSVCIMEFITGWWIQ